MEAMADNHLDSDEILEPGERKSRGALSEGTLPVQATHADREASRAAIDELALGATVEIEFVLPDGKKLRHEVDFREGQEVAVLKLELEQLTGLPASNQVLKCTGGSAGETASQSMLMLDPLSLRDYPAVRDRAASGAGATVTVTVELQH